MNTKQLRQKILDLAIRGKLVPQDPNDEPASVLLERIRAEKERLIKEKKIKPDKKKSGAKSHCEKDVPFEVPESWEWVKLGYLCDYGKNEKASPSEINENAWILDLEDIEKDTGKLLKRVHKSEKETKSIRNTFKKGDVLYSKLRTYLNKVLVADFEGYCTTEILPLDFNGFVVPEFARHVLMSNYFLEYTAECCYGVKMPRLGTYDGENALFPLPPIEEQKRIVRIIDSVNEIIDEIEESALSLEQYITQTKSKVLDLAIRGKLVPQNPDDEPASVLLEQVMKGQKVQQNTADKFPYPFEIPKNWEWCRLHDIADVSLGKTLDRLKNTGVFKCYLRSINVKWGIIDLSDVKEMKFEEEEEERYSLKYGDLLICEGGEAGRAAVWKYKDKSMRYQNAIHRIRFNFDFEADFYMYVFWHYHNSKILDKYSKGVTIKHLTGQALKQMRFPLPPIAEQKRIVSQIENMFFQLDIIEEALKA